MPPQLWTKVCLEMKWLLTAVQRAFTGWISEIPSSTQNCAASGVAQMILSLTS